MTAPARYICATTGAGSNFRALIYIRPAGGSVHIERFVEQHPEPFRSRAEANKWGRARIAELTAEAIGLVWSAAGLHNDGETAGGLTGDDALELLEGLISGARQIGGDPRYPVTE